MYTRARRDRSFLAAALAPLRARVIFNLRLREVYCEEGLQEKERQEERERERKNRDD